METDPGRTKFVPDVESAAKSPGCVIIVALALADWPEEELVAIILTPYVPGAVPDGEFLSIATAIDWPGASVNADCERDVVHPDGSEEASVKLLGGQDAVSLLVINAE
jgi:hypothetical protein